MQTVTPEPPPLVLASKLRDQIADLIHQLGNEPGDALAEAGLETAIDSVEDALNETLADLDDFLDLGGDPAIYRYFAGRAGGDSLDQIRADDPQMWPAVAAVHASFEARFPTLAGQVAARTLCRAYDPRVRRRLRRALSLIAAQRAGGE